MTDAYRVLPPPEKGEENPEVLWLSIGRAFTSWERLEDEISDLFAVFTGGAPGGQASPAKRAYGAIVGFKGRQDMVSAAAEMFFGQPIIGPVDVAAGKAAEKETKSLLNDAGKLAARRNEIAHGQVKQFAIHSPRFQELGLKTDLTWYLLPPGYNSKKTVGLYPHLTVNAKERDENTALRQFFAELMRTGLGTYKYNAAQVDHYRSEFDALATRAMRLTDQVLRLRGS
jgi:hypothetical protein